MEYLTEITEAISATADKAAQDHKRDAVWTPVERHCPLYRRLALIRDIAALQREFRNRADDCTRNNRTERAMAKSTAYHKAANRIEDTLTRHGWTNAPVMPTASTETQQTR